MCARGMVGRRGASRVVMSTDQRHTVVAEGNEIIIFLEADDDVGSVRTKLEHVRGRRVALVVPPYTAALRRGIAVRLLRRIAEGFAIDLSLVSADGEVQRLAREENVRIFQSVRAFRRYAERAEREVPEFGQPPASFDKASRLLIAGGSLVAMMLTVLILAFAFIPSAQVTLRPATDSISETIELRADPEARGIDYVGRRVPARAIYDRVEGTDQVPVTGAGNPGEARAQGRVTFTNRSGQEVAIPAGTIVLTPQGVKFVVTQEAHLPPAAGAWTRADIRAVDPGPKGNVARGLISQVEGPLARQITVFNEESTTSGSPGDTGTVTDADRKRLHDQLYERLSTEAIAKLQAAVRSDETLPPQTVKLVTLEESYDRRVGEQARALNVRMEVRVNGTAFELADVNNLAERAWQPRLRTGFAIVPDSVRLLPPEIARLEGDVVVLHLRVEGIAAARINTEQVADAVRWRRPTNAVDALARIFVLAEQPQVVVEPGWASRAFRVHVVVKNQ